MELDELREERRELKRQVTVMDSEYLKLKDKEYSFIGRKEIRGKIRDIITRLEIIEKQISH